MGLVSSNIMYDRRVIRGNTYAAQILPAAPPNENLGGSTKRHKAGGGGQGQRYQGAGGAAPGAVEGRRHIDVQTDSFLEELTDTVPERDVNTQTDPFMDRPPTPLFIPMKIGMDAETQIEAGDLFDFDFEVEPILEVLVGKTLEQGLMEVMEEEELAAMRAHQEHFEQIRNAELVATQRMEAAEKRKIEEKERRLAQERDRLEREKQVREKVAAQTFARGYLTGLVGNVFDKLFEQGYFYDPVEKEVQEEFMPWLQTQVGEAISTEAVSRAAVDAVIEAAQTRAVAQRQAAEDARSQQKKQEEEAQAAAEAAQVAETERAKKALDDLTHMILHELNLVSEELVQAAVEALTVIPEPEPIPEPEAAPEGEEGDAPAEPVEPAEPPPPPEPIIPTEIMVLDKLLADGSITKEAIQEALVRKNMGEQHYTQDPLYVPEG